MTNQEKIERIQKWQAAGFVHPLTCGNDSGHRDLVPREMLGKVELWCLDCGYAQQDIPEVVFFTPSPLDKVQETIDLLNRGVKP